MATEKPTLSALEEQVNPAVVEDVQAAPEATPEVAENEPVETTAEVDFSDEEAALAACEAGLELDEETAEEAVEAEEQAAQDAAEQEAEEQATQDATEQEAEEQAAQEAVEQEAEEQIVNGFLK